MKRLVFNAHVNLGWALVSLCSTLFGIGLGLVIGLGVHVAGAGVRVVEALRACAF